MKENETKIIDCLELPHGLEIDLDEGWRKLISRQFGGDPGRAFGELIQNLLDSYPSNTPWEERRGEIETNKNSISITDYGEGMDRERLKLITTLGGTDKSNDPSKIGTFGVGFFSVFNPKLGTETVRVITRCEGHTVELVFYVEHPEKRPRISTQVLQSTPSFSTKIEVKFNNNNSVKKCLEHATVCLKYYPCRIFVNGQLLASVWEEARDSGAVMFAQDHCHGFITTRQWGDSIVRLLCKYQYLMYLSIPGLITGGHDMTHDLRDYHRKEVPFLPALDMTLNCNNLMVTISRDNFFLDSAYRAMIKVLARKVLLHLGQNLNDRTEKCLKIANQYILAKKIKAYLQRKSEGKIQTMESEEDSVIRRLAETKVYRLSGRKQLYSLIDIQKMLSQDIPLFFSSEQTNIRWLKGVFKHDFIVLPPKILLGHGAPDLYDTLFGEVFEEVVNLDTIMGENEKIIKLVERGIASKSALSPKCKFIKERKLTEEERKLLQKIDVILEDETVKHAIEKNIFIRFRKIQTVFFDLEEQGVVLATGLFEKEGKALEESAYSNFDLEGDKGGMTVSKDDQTILLGLSRDHFFIRHLVDVEDTHKAYYALTFLTYELALCQKLLVPYSPFYHVTAQKLAADMRRALMQQLLSDK
jgi:hypothetical protein